jgi:hypothetical protein
MVITLVHSITAAVATLFPGQEESLAAEEGKFLDY